MNDTIQRLTELSAGLAGAYYRVKLTMLEELLATVPTDLDAYRYVATKAGVNSANIEAELAEMQANEKEVGGEKRGNRNGNGDGSERPNTAFLKDEHGASYFRSDVIGAACMEWARHMRRTPTSYSSQVSAYQQVLRGGMTVFGEMLHDYVHARRIYILGKGGLSIVKRTVPVTSREGFTDRAIVSSQAAPVDSTIMFYLAVIQSDTITSEWLTELLLFGGRYIKLGQWRSGPYGAFDYQLDLWNPDLEQWQEIPRAWTPPKGGDARQKKGRKGKAAE